MIALRCPTCRTRLKAPDSAAGQVLRCARCHSMVAVPDAAAAIEADLAAAAQPAPPPVVTLPEELRQPVEQHANMPLEPVHAEVRALSLRLAEDLAVAKHASRRSSAVEQWIDTATAVIVGVALVCAAGAFAVFVAHEIGEWWLSVAFLSALIGAGIANRRHGLLPGLQLGLALGPVGVLLALLVDRRPLCPHCREHVAAMATRCPHCQANIGHVIEV